MATASSYHPSTHHDHHRPAYDNGHGEPQMPTIPTHTTQPTMPSSQSQSQYQRQHQQPSSSSSSTSSQQEQSEAKEEPKHGETSLPKEHYRSELAPQFWWTIRPFVLGGVSACFAQTIIQPIDMVKTRTQLAGEGKGRGFKSSPIAIAKEVIKNDGFLKLYSGLSAAYMRQVTYGVGRLGLFRTLADHLQRKQDAELGYHAPLPFYYKMLCGLAAGGFGAVLGTPADVALVRMQTDSMLPKDQRRNYTSGINAIVHIVKDEGISGMFAGCGPTVARAMAQNMMMLGCYEQAKDFYYTTSLGKSHKANLAASLTAGVAACVVSLPFDFMKTRMQKQKRLPDGSWPYNSVMDVFRKTLKNEGILGFYRGFTMYVMRIAPHSMITLTTLDFLVDKFKQHGF